MDLLGKDLVETDCLQNVVGLSPIGVVWAVSCISQCGSVTFQQIMLERVHVNCINDLISGAHLKLLKSWCGPGGGLNGVREIIDAAIDFLAFPFVATENSLGYPSVTASMYSGIPLNVSSPAANLYMEEGDNKKEIKENMGKYVEILIEVRWSFTTSYYIQVFSHFFYI